MRYQREEIKFIEDYFDNIDSHALLAHTLVSSGGYLSQQVRPLGKDVNFWRTDRVTQRHIPRYRPDYYSTLWGEHSMPAEPYPTEEEVVAKIRGYVLYSWRDVVCTCYMPTYGIDGRKCTKCQKWARWLYVRRCSECNNPFVKAFVHPYKDTHTSMCYGCLVTRYGDEGSENFVTEKPKDIGKMDSFDFSLPETPTLDF